MHTDFFQQALDLSNYTRSVRRDLHRHPELGFQEFRTAGVIARDLTGLGLELHTGVAETGVVAMIEGMQPGPVLLLRFDMDALPVNEDTGAEYASQNPGVMHACGHDAHVAIGLTVARLLSAAREEIHGTVKLIFQPAEEGLGGAERMLAEGILDGPNVDYTLSMHVWNERPVGWVGVSPGPIMAGAEIFDVTIEGRGGHGALPHTTLDPVAAAAQVISALQTIVSRNVSPLDTAVVSVCQVHGGDAFNVIPQSVKLSGTLRTFRPEVRQIAVRRFHDLVKGISESMGCRAEVSLKKLTPAVINDEKVTALVKQAVAGVFPDIRLDEGYQSMVSEDMAYIMEEAPGCYVLVGSGYSEVEKNYGHHHPRFNINEDVLPRAAAVVAASALEILKRG